MLQFHNYLSDDKLPVENFVVLGDVNFHVEKSENPDTRRFLELYSSLGFSQLVKESTHVKKHTLDVVLTRNNAFVSRVTVDDMCMSDHFLITLDTDFSRPRLPRKTVQCRNVKLIDRMQFRLDLQKSAPFTDVTDDDVDILVDCYNEPCPLC